MIEVSIYRIHFEKKFSGYLRPLQTWYTIMYVILISCIHKNFWDILTVLWKNIEIFPCEFTSHVDMHAVLYKDTELILQEDKVWKMEKQKPYLQL